MVVTQDYGWSQIARRRHLGWPDGTEWAMTQARKAGMAGWEPFLASPQDADRVMAVAKRCGLEMPSFFVAGTLHSEAGAEIARMTEIAARAAKFGARMAAVYPVSLGDADKSDAQLAVQFENLHRLARQFSQLGVRLLYHPEEPEMRHAAREFHHMLARTDPDLIGLCLDPDTIWRGAGRSNLAVLDMIALYGSRVDAIHLRQSVDGIWSETLGPGDLDYPAIAAALQAAGRAPLLVIETASEDNKPQVLDPSAAQQQSLAYVLATFGRS